MLQLNTHLLDPTLPRTNLLITSHQLHTNLFTISHQPLLTTSQHTHMFTILNQPHTLMSIQDQPHTHMFTILDQPQPLMFTIIDQPLMSMLDHLPTTHTAALIIIKIPSKEL